MCINPFNYPIKDTGRVCVMYADYLLEARSNTVNKIHCHIMEKYFYQFDPNENKGYIYYEGDNTVEFSSRLTPEISFTDNAPLIDILNIGFFIHNEIIKDFNSIDYYLHHVNSRLDNMDAIEAFLINPLYEKLINKTLDFCYKYGNYHSTEIVDGKYIDRLDVEYFISKSSNIYLNYRDFVEREDIDDELLDYFASTDLKTKVYITPVFDNNRKIRLSYDFDNIFELVKYQMLLSLINNENKIGLCPYCNTFFRGERRQKFCSKSHANMYLKGKKANKIKICKCCKKPFEPMNQREEYCCISCKRKYQNQTAKQKKEGENK